MKKTRLIYLSLAILAGLQMVWWAYLIFNQQAEIASLINNPAAFEKAESYQRMIIVEFLFFISIWSFGLLYVYRSFNKEFKLQQDKKTFLSLITHDLKTPLTSIQMIIETLGRKEVDAAMQKAYLERAAKNVTRLDAQIEKILSYNEVSKSRSKVEFNLKDIVYKSLELLDIEESAYQLNLDDTIMFAAKEEVEAITQNLISNAYKYASIDQQAEIIIRCYVENHKAILSIQDNGIGFTKSDLDKAFEPFWRGELAKKHAVNGSGMGLNIVKELCKKTKAAIKISSPGNKAGTIIDVKWPLGNK